MPHHKTLIAIGLVCGILATLLYTDKSHDSQTTSTELGSEKVASALVRELMIKREYAQLEKLADLSLKSGGSKSDSLLLKAIAQQRRGQDQDAIQTYKKLIEEFPTLITSYNNLAAIYANNGQFEKARETLEQGISANPDLKIAYRNISSVFAKMADQAYNKALDLQPSKGQEKLQLALLENTDSFDLAMPATAVAEFSSKKTTKPEVTVALAPETQPTPSPAAVEPVEKSKINVTVITKNDKKQPSQSSAPAPTPVTSPTPPSKAVQPAQPSAPPASAQQDIQKVLQAWASDWSKQDVKSYLGHYAANFDTGGMNRSQWETDRRNRIAGKSRIAVSISDIQVTQTSSTQAVVKFRQNYRSDRLNSQTAKSMTLELKSGQWRITAEKAGGKG